MSLRWKGELADGHIHMTAMEYWEHKSKENFETQKQILRKTANNPILTNEVKEAIRFAVYRMDDVLWWRNEYIQLNEQYKRVMKERNNNESV